MRIHLVVGAGCGARGNRLRGDTPSCASERNRCSKACARPRAIAGLRNQWFVDCDRRPWRTSSAAGKSKQRTVTVPPTIMGVPPGKSSARGCVPTTFRNACGRGSARTARRRCGTRLLPRGGVALRGVFAAPTGRGPLAVFSQRRRGLGSCGPQCVLAPSVPPLTRV